MFSINVSNLHWLEGVDQTEDICLHGHASVVIGNECFKYNATVSATGLYLLKSLKEDHNVDNGIQLLPCCGFFMIPDPSLSKVEILGCQSGIDWSVIHRDDSVELITQSGKKTIIPMEDYKQAVFSFADEIEEFYKNSAEKKLSDDEYTRNGYIAFWNEWKTRRYCE